MTGLLIFLSGVIIGSRLLEQKWQIVVATVLVVIGIILGALPNFRL